MSHARVSRPSCAFQFISPCLAVWFLHTHTHTQTVKGELMWLFDFCVPDLKAFGTKRINKMTCCVRFLLTSGVSALQILFHIALPVVSLPHCPLSAMDTKGWHCAELPANLLTLTFILPAESRFYVRTIHSGCTHTQSADKYMLDDMHYQCEHTINSLNYSIHFWISTNNSNTRLKTQVLTRN